MGRQRRGARFAVGVVAVGLAIGLIGALPAQAGSGSTTAADCFFLATVVHDPGYWLLQPQNGTLSSVGSVALSCTGTAEGVALVPGAGTIDITGTYSDGTCAVVPAGTLSVTVSVPEQNGGSFQRTGSLQWSRLGPLVQASGTLGGYAAGLTYAGAPDPQYPGDCVLEPLRYVVGAGELTFHS